MIASLTFLTPDAAWFAALAAVPVLALVVGRRRVALVRRVLHLPPPGRRAPFWRGGGLVLIVLLLVVTAMQPVVRSRTGLQARTDAEVFVVFDTSRSMAASPTPGGPDRLARAKTLAAGIVARLGGVPIGVATFTDRVLPDLFPTADQAAVTGVLNAVTVESPPPRDTFTVATTFDALTSLATQGFFPSSVEKRAVLLVTDGESRAFDPGAVAGALRQAHITLAVARVGSGADRVWHPDGTPEANYRPDPAGAKASIGQLRAALGEAPNADPEALLARALGRGPTRIVGTIVHTRTLAPFVALLALLPLLALLLLSDWSQVFARSNIFFFRSPKRERVSA
jgi:hypothetical protein